MGCRHLEQMYSDLGSQWRKALRKAGGVDDDMLAIGMGCYRRSSLVVVGLWGVFGSDTQRAELTEFTDAAGLW